MRVIGRCVNAGKYCSFKLHQDISQPTEGVMKHGGYSNMVIKPDHCEGRNISSYYRDVPKFRTNGSEQTVDPDLEAV